MGMGVWQGVIRVLVWRNLALHATIQEEELPPPTLPLFLAEIAITESSKQAKLATQGRLLSSAVMAIVAWSVGLHVIILEAALAQEIQQL